MARMSIAVQDDNGFYSIAPGASPVLWGMALADVQYEYSADEVDDVDTERLTGWGRWTWGILVNGTCVAFVDGDDEPSGEELPFDGGMP